MCEKRREKIIALIKEMEPGLFRGGPVDQGVVTRRVKKVLSNYKTEEILAYGVLALMEKRKQRRNTPIG